MRVDVDRRAFVSALKFTAGAAAKNPTQPVLAGVRIEQHNGTLSLQCSDLDVTYSDSLPAKGTKGVAITPADLLLRVTERMAGETVTLEAGDTLTVTSGETIAVLPCWPSEQWPKIETPDGNPEIITGGEADRLASILPMASTDQNDPKLSAVHFVDGEAVTTDKYRMGVVTGLAIKRDALVSAAALRNVLHGEDVEVRFADLLASFTSGSRSVTLRQVEADYPDHAKVFPAAPPHRLEVAGPALAESALRVAAIGLDSANPRLTMQRDGGKLIVNGTDGKGGSVTDVIACAGDYNGEIGFRPEQLADMLAACGDEVVLLVTSNMHPVIVEESGLRLLIMPVRVAQ